jgi:hypothetical protein
MCARNLHSSHRRTEQIAATTDSRADSKKTAPPGHLPGGAVTRFPPAPPSAPATPAHSAVAVRGVLFCCAQKPKVPSQKFFGTAGCYPRWAPYGVGESPDLWNSSYMASVKRRRTRSHSCWGKYPVMMVSAAFAALTASSSAPCATSSRPRVMAGRSREYRCFAPDEQPHGAPERRHPVDDLRLVPALSEPKLYTGRHVIRVEDTRYLTAATASLQP